MGELQTFFSSIEQIAGGRDKGIVVSSAGYTKQALEFARSKGIGLVRHFPEDGFKWELRRSPVGSRWTDSDTSEIERGLLINEYEDANSTFYCFAPTSPVNTFNELLATLTGSAVDSSNRATTANTLVGYLSKEDIDAEVQRSCGIASRISGFSTMPAMVACDAWAIACRPNRNLHQPDHRSQVALRVVAVADRLTLGVAHAGDPALRIAVDRDLPAIRVHHLVVVHEHPVVIQRRFDFQVRDPGVELEQLLKPTLMFEDPGGELRAVVVAGDHAVDHAAEGGVIGYVLGEQSRDTRSFRRVSGRPSLASTSACSARSGGSTSGGKILDAADQHNVEVARVANRVSESMTLMAALASL